jgi:hypothetical protein
MATINPFQGPINYSVDVQSPFEAALGGFKIGAAGAEAQAQRQAQEKAKTYQTGFDAVFSKPAAQRTTDEIQSLFAGANKQQLDALQAITKNMSDEKVNSSKRFYGQLLVSLEQNPETAKIILQDRIEAEPDKNQKLAFQDTLKAIDVSPKNVAEQIELLGTAVFGKEWHEGITSVRSERRTAAEAPAALSKKVADAEAAVSDAQKKADEAKDTPARLVAEQRLRVAQAQEAETKAEFTRANQVLDVQQKGAQLGLTNAQRDSALAQTRKLNSEIQKAALELEALKASGGVDPAKTFDQEEKIRKEFQLRTKEYGTLGTTFQTIKTSAESKNGPGDIALITSFMKMIDPGAIVRETDFALARDTAGLLQELKNQAGKLESGAIFTLDSKQRQEYVNLAAQYLEAGKKKADQDKKALGVVVKNYKLNPENVFGPETAEPPPTPLPASATIGGRTYTRPATFTDAQWRDYLKANGVIQ